MIYVKYIKEILYTHWQLSKHSLSYVRPSTPQTGFEMYGQSQSLPWNENVLNIYLYILYIHCSK